MFCFLSWLRLSRRSLRLRLRRAVIFAPSCGRCFNAHPRPFPAPCRFRDQQSQTRADEQRNPGML